MKNYWVYNLANPKRSIYTGVTNNLERRLWEHRTGYGSQLAFAHRLGCRDLVLAENYTDIRDAIAREKEIKGWTREKKIALIETTNPNWDDVSESWTDDVASGT